MKIIKIAGGLNRDDDMAKFGDYWYSILEAKIIFEDHNIKPPYLIESPSIVIQEASTGNHFKPIATKFNNKVKIWYLEDMKEIEGIINEVVVNEYAYIVSQEWISEWKINEELYHKDGDPLIHISKDNLIVQIGKRCGLTWNLY